MKENRQYHIWIMGNRALAYDDAMALGWMKFCMERKIVPNIERVRKPKEGEKK